MREPGTGTTAAPVEERLRAALAARARSVGPGDLRPLRPPVTAVRRHRVLRRTAAGVLALAAVAALLFLALRDGPPHRAEPARIPRPGPSRPVTGTPSPVPGPVTPSPFRPSPSTRPPGG
ncbi:hypothetical protein ACIQVT_04550 [Streptomyces sp. NPDC100445]|uniref:hypothetical protein n=1 Tax=Streptomyces sp. NPDC100445 TaxID=3366102 RepID=UPI00381F05CD